MYQGIDELVDEPAHVERHGLTEDVDHRCHDRQGAPTVGIGVVVALCAQVEPHIVAQLDAQGAAVAGILHVAHGSHAVKALVEIVLPEEVEAQAVREPVAGTAEEAIVVPGIAAHVILHAAHASREREAVVVVDARKRQTRRAHCAQGRECGVAATGTQIGIVVAGNHAAGAPVAAVGVAVEIVAWLNPEGLAGRAMKHGQHGHLVAQATQVVAHLGHLQRAVVEGGRRDHIGGGKGDHRLQRLQCGHIELEPGHSQRVEPLLRSNRHGHGRHRHDCYHESPFHHSAIIDHRIIGVFLQSAGAIVPL